MPSSFLKNQAQALIDRASAATTPGGMLRAAFEFPEMYGQKDPWIRTKVRTAKGGSTAYGPNQVTAKLARQFKRYRSKIFDEEEKEYLDRFILQGKEFLKFGNEPHRAGFHPRYDYGGKGDLSSPEDQKLYDRMATKMLDWYYTKYKGDVKKVINAWRFGENSKEDTFKVEPHYPKAIFTILKNAR